MAQTTGLIRRQTLKPHRLHWVLWKLKTTWSKWKLNCLQLKNTLPSHQSQYQQCNKSHLLTRPLHAPRRRCSQSRLLQHGICILLSADEQKSLIRTGGPLKGGWRWGGAKAHGSRFRLNPAVGFSCYRYYDGICIVFKRIWTRFSVKGIGWVGLVWGKPKWAGNLFTVKLRG